MTILDGVRIFEIAIGRMSADLALYKPSFEGDVGVVLPKGVVLGWTIL